MGFKDKFRSFFEFDDYDDFQESNKERKRQDNTYERSKAYDNKDNIVNLTSIQNDSRMVLCEPTSYDEAQSMSDYIKKKQSIVVNLQRLDHQTSRRVVDFLSGTVYALNGNIQKLGQQTFLCTPEHVSVSGNITELFNDEENN